MNEETSLYAKYLKEEEEKNRARTSEPPLSQPPAPEPEPVHTAPPAPSPAPAQHSAPNPAPVHAPAPQTAPHSPQSLAYSGEHIAASTLSAPKGSLHYTIHGHDIQFVEIHLYPGETAVSEAGMLMYMDNGVQMSTRLGDGSEKGSGVMGSLMSAGKRYMVGENMFMTIFVNNSNHVAKVAFAAEMPGTIIPFDIGQLGTVLCQKGAFLCGTKGVSIGMGFTKRVGAGMLGGDGYVLEKLNGKGIAFINAGGSILERTLRPEEIIYVESGSVVAFQESVDFSIKMLQGISNQLLGGENLFMSTLKGPGKVWIQSMPFYSLVHVLRQAMRETMSGKDRKKERKRFRKLTK